MRHLFIAMGLIVLALGGCGGAGQEPAAAGEGEPEGVLLDAARQPLERAQEVEDLSAGRKAQLDEEIGRGDE